MNFTPVTLREQILDTLGKSEKVINTRIDTLENVYIATVEIGAEDTIKIKKEIINDELQIQIDELIESDFLLDVIDPESFDFVTFKLNEPLQKRLTELKFSNKEEFLTFLNLNMADLEETTYENTLNDEAKTIDTEEENTADNQEIENNQELDNCNTTMSVHDINHVQ
jgi:hypothetical protein